MRFRGGLHRIAPSLKRNSRQAPYMVRNAPSGVSSPDEEYESDVPSAPVKREKDNYDFVQPALASDSDSLTDAPARYPVPLSSRQGLAAAMNAAARFTGLTKRPTHSVDRPTNAMNRIEKQAYFPKRRPSTHASKGLKLELEDEESLNVIPASISTYFSATGSGNNAHNDTNDMLDTIMADNDDIDSKYYQYRSERKSNAIQPNPKLINNSYLFDSNGRYRGASRFTTRPTRGITRAAAPSRVIIPLRATAPPCALMRSSPSPDPTELQEQYTSDSGEDTPDEDDSSASSSPSPQQSVYRGFESATLSTCNSIRGSSILGDDELQTANMLQASTTNQYTGPTTPVVVGTTATGLHGDRNTVLETVTAEKKYTPDQQMWLLSHVRDSTHPRPNLSDTRYWKAAVELFADQFGEHRTGCALYAKWWSLNQHQEREQAISQPPSSSSVDVGVPTDKGSGDSSPTSIGKPNITDNGIDPDTTSDGPKTTDNGSSRAAESAVDNLDQSPKSTPNRVYSYDRRQDDWIIWYSSQNPRSTVAESLKEYWITASDSFFTKFHIRLSGRALQCKHRVLAITVSRNKRRSELRSSARVQSTVITQPDTGTVQPDAKLPSTIEDIHDTNTPDDTNPCALVIAPENKSYTDLQQGWLLGYIDAHELNARSQSFIEYWEKVAMTFSTTFDVRATASSICSKYYQEWKAQVDTNKGPIEIDTDSEGDSNIGPEAILNKHFRAVIDERRNSKVTPAAGEETNTTGSEIQPSPAHSPSLPNAEYNYRQTADNDDELSRIDAHFEQRTREPAGKINLDTIMNEAPIIVKALGIFHPGPSTPSPRGCSGPEPEDHSSGSPVPFVIKPAVSGTDILSDSTFIPSRPYMEHTESKTGFIMSIQTAAPSLHSVATPTTVGESK